MLEVLHALAVRLHWLRLVSVFVILGFGALFAFAALSENAPDSFFTSGLAGLSWGLLLYIFVSVFQQIPALPNRQDSWWQRVRLRLSRWGYGFLGLATLGFTIAVVVMTIRLL